MKTCVDCGRTFERKHGRICNTCTSKRYRARHGRKRSATDLTYRPKAVVKSCGWCGVEYETRERRSTACSAVHGRWLAAHGAPSASRELVHVPEEPRRWVSRFTPTPHPPRWWAVLVQGPCAWCGEEFTAPTGTGQARHCSKNCARSATKYARGKRFIIAPRVRQRIYERDGWRCQICGFPVAHRYSAHDPFSPTLDHIVPQSHTLIPDHSESNLRTACALCNSLRGDDSRSDDEVRAELLIRLA